MSSSVKPRLAGRQPSYRGGVLRVTTRRRANALDASAGSAGRTPRTTGGDMSRYTTTIELSRRAAVGTPFRTASYGTSTQRRHVDQGRLSSGLC